MNDFLSYWFRRRPTAAAGRTGGAEAGLDRTRWVGRAWHLAAAAIVFLVFAQLAVRHAGNSTFLVDQADQLQFFERLLRLDPNALRGPYMSSPDPPTRSLGPLAALAFGGPFSLGFGVEAVQTLTSLALVVTTIVAFAALARLDVPFAWLWLILFLATPIVWWNAGMLWGNTLLLPIGNLLLAVMALCLLAPTFVKWWLMPLLVWLAGHLNLVAITGLAPVAVVGARTLLPAWRRLPGRAALAALLVFAALALGPYWLGEVMDDFSNARALIAHGSRERAPEVGTDAVQPFQALQRTADPGELFQRAGASPWTAIVLGSVVAAASLIVWAVPGLRPSNRTPQHRAIAWLVGASIVGVAAQAVFFTLEQRELLSYHYITLLLPLYSLPLAALLARPAAAVAPRAKAAASAALAAACALMMLVAGSDWADRYWERTPWTYENIVWAIDTLCGSEAVRVAEGPGFDSLMPGNDGVLTYLMTRGHVKCRLDPASELMLAAENQRNYPEERQDADGTFIRVDVADPGIALYRHQSP